MDDIEKRMQQLRAKAEAITPTGPARGDDPRPWQYRADVLWLVTQLETSREECERLRGLLDGFPRPPLYINTPDDLGGKL